MKQKMKQNIHIPSMSSIKTILGFALVLISMACEDDEPRAATRGFSNVPTAPSQNAVSEGANIPEGVIAEIKIPVPERFKVNELFTPQGWTSIEKIRQSYQYSSTEQARIRDPFFPDIPELKGETIQVSDVSSIEKNLKVAVEATPQELKLIMTFTKTIPIQASVVDASGTDHLVKVGDIIGKSPEYVRVSHISNDHIKFEPLLGVSAEDPNLKQKTFKSLGADQK
jgi:Tfp pilus assembly protein PilP